VSVVRRYLDAVAGQDWETASSCLAQNIRRVGPFGDTYEGRTGYLNFLRDLMPSLVGYGMQINRLIEAGPVVVVELSETVVHNGQALETAESLVFDLDEDGLIAHISIYLQKASEPSH
jgi:predicted ester cyclase